MNGPEKKVLHLAIFLFALGVMVRILPWGLPTIESVQVDDLATRDLVTDGVVSAPPDSSVLYKVTDGGRWNSENKGERKSENEKKTTKKKSKVVLPIHLNTATAEELCALNGVGPKLAEKILAHREASGPFKSPKDLEKVPGIGKKKLDAILPGVIFD